jgi:hypothetical protein
MKTTQGNPQKAVKNWGEGEKTEQSTYNICMCDIPQGKPFVQLIYSQKKYRNWYQFSYIL